MYYISFVKCDIVNCISAHKSGYFSFFGRKVYFEIGVNLNFMHSALFYLQKCVLLVYVFETKDLFLILKVDIERVNALCAKNNVQDLL